MTDILVEGANPGSYNDFVARNELAANQEAVNRHADAIAKYRLALAAQQGISLEELHLHPQVNSGGLEQLSV